MDVADEVAAAEFLYDYNVQYRAVPTHLWCTNRVIADHLADRIRTAKQRYDNLCQARSYARGIEAPI